jgi:hypothetical protein
MADTTMDATTGRPGSARRNQPQGLVEAIARIETVSPRLDAVIRTRFDRRGWGRQQHRTGHFASTDRYKDLGCLVAGEPTAFGLAPRDHGLAGDLSRRAVQGRGLHLSRPHNARGWARR